MKIKNPEINLMSRRLNLLGSLPVVLIAFTIGGCTQQSDSNGALPLAQNAATQSSMPIAPTPTPSPELILQQKVTPKPMQKSTGFLTSLGDLGHSTNHYELFGGTGPNAGITIDVVGDMIGSEPTTKIVRIGVKNVTGHLVSIEIAGMPEPVEVLRDDQKEFEFSGFRILKETLGQNAKNIPNYYIPLERQDQPSYGLTEANVTVKAITSGYSKPIQIAETEKEKCVLSVCLSTSYTPPSVGRVEDFVVDLESKVNHPMRVEVNGQKVVLQPKGFRKLNFPKKQTLSGTVTLQSL